ncbi:MAG: potassium transporter Kup [Hyphomonadaceae bacterium JAD_PAG50586_4]|nr:MAG: potassium transporter Kup [Hyphomonadaceae bacterium JAD_PAG50586_4]
MAQASAGAPKPENSAPSNGHGHAAHAGFWTLLIGSIGVVYGDIGTSPLYAFKESFSHLLTEGRGVAEAEEVLGIISLIFWALMIVVTLKYIVIVMQMDNKGEGGTLSLMALAQRALGKRTPLLFLVGVAGASMFYGDALITPAISVLSAVEGLRAVPALEGSIDPFILPIGIGILVGLFAIQSRGTGVMGRYFGPITAIWFITMGVLGAFQIATNPGVFAALSPVHAISFMIEHQFLTFVVLGSVFLAVTGAEALYADMGHFGRRPIRVAWVGLVLPALTLNYLGQGAFVLGQLDVINAEYAIAREAARAVGADSVSFEFSPFFEMAPEMIRLPLVILATAATVIASQAVISGAFSLTQQAIQLGLLPRMEIRRTSETQAGQIYMPQVNWLLLAGVLVLTLAFGSSTRLAAAYGISITGEMLMSTVMVFIVIWKLWKRPVALAAAIITPFVIIELIFLSSNLQRVWSGGFVPLLLAIGLIVIMWTWVRGTRLLAETVRRDESLAKLFETLSHHPPHRVRGAAIFLTGDPDVAPAALMHNLKHNQVLHEQIIILTVKTINAPRAPESERVKIEDFMPDVKRVQLTFGFMETPNVVKALTEARKHGLKFDIMKTSFFLSRRTIVPSEKSGMPLWQDHLFIFLARNATNATDFFHIPSGRAVELGNQVMV